MRNKKVACLLALCALGLFFTGCSGDKPETGKTSNPQTNSTAQAPASADKAEAGAPEQQVPVVVTGKVKETMDASGYTYMLLDRGGKESWVALPAAKVTVGQEVSVIQSMVMPNFESKALNRKFDEVIFASSLAGGAGTDKAAAPVPAEAAGHGAGSFSDAVKSEGAAAPAVPNAALGSSKAIVPFNEIKVAKAQGENARTVGEIFAQKAELNGKPVAVRGKVVKVSQGIMGKNWIHLQDGTGNPVENTHDLVITTMEVPVKDSEITITGTMVADKDFGSGYKYSAIIEEGKVTK